MPSACSSAIDPLQSEMDEDEEDDEMQELQDELDEKQRQLELAAQMGQQLLEQLDIKV